METGFCLIATAPAGPVVIDDGPVRTLHDTQCRSYRERAAWWDYGKQALVRLGQFRTPVLLVDWHIDDRLRMQRWRSRGATTDRRRGVLPTVMVRLLDALTGHQRLAPVPANGRAVRAFMRKHLPHVSQLTVDATAADTPGEIAERIIRLLESAPIGQHDKQAPAG
ncbi:hypothetical protein [Aquisalimonas sp.]|uniref:hypothetical protein n=1 Tax=Aquisalimonas sp. TaxID=1872621 RepID=UPI0025B8697A|nr:hypothetical protein [Aquisalimonas sp.]